MFPEKPNTKNLATHKLARKTLASPPQPRPISFELDQAVNPLIAIAAPILTLASQIRNSGDESNIKELQLRFLHEFTLFENRAHAHGYPSQMILAARYLICSLIDEIVLTSSWGKYSLWSQQTLIELFQGDSKSGEHFFLILERSADDPKLYIDVLELGYLCLSLGFQGTYHEGNKQELSDFIDNLFDLIQEIRGENKKSLWIQNKKQKNKKSRLRLLPPIWLTLIITLVALFLIFLPYYYKLEGVHKQLLNNIPLNTSLLVRGGNS